MNLLAVDSCSNVATCALTKDNKLIAEAVINDKKTHSVKLLPLIEKLLNDVNTDVSEIDYFAVTAGPGSFTGQRIGIATVKGLCHAMRKKCVSVSSLEALAYNIPHTSYLVCPIMDARRDRVYTATFQNLNYLVGDRVIALSELLNEVKGKDTIFVGDGVDVFRQTIIESNGNHAYFPPTHLVHLRAGSVAAAALKYIDKGLAVNWDELMPTYLQKSQAEREREENL
ncbi:MAG: tRNA (adenosine(37)-N6)-threonylcarbamoyltransferase complex dimerization subunit type 1 TsaB [Clostridiaceae bacterium]|nr:tRNA (adenosine(37)-N6)-threonylcarbamoyltransferase complex dimerization subunit type 1 TsaB [Clostridiaceae bacterium]